MPQRRNLRPALLWVHRWLGLTAGLLLMLNALTGALMLGARPLDRWVNAALFSVPPTAQSQPLESLRGALEAEFGPGSRFTLRPPRAADESVLVYVRSPAWDGQVYFNPATGERLGARGETEGFANSLFEFHSALLLGDTGKAVLAVNVLTMAGMLFTGLWLWWPKRWAAGFNVQLRRGLLRGLFDLHRVAGAVLGVWVLVCVGTGAWMAWRPMSQWVTQIAGQKAVKPPKLPAEVPALASGPRATLDAMVATANAALPGGVAGFVQWPDTRDGLQTPVRIRKKLADDPHPNGLSSVWLHPQSGAVLRVDRWDALDPGTRSYAWVYPLHSGQLAGALGVVATAAGGLVLFGFGLSGTWLWWLRRRTRAPVKRVRQATDPV
jgi:uncharacterized iron-regulated membrane protein